MAYPQTLPGWRRITVDGRVYRWVLYDELVVVLPPLSGCRRVAVELVGWKSLSSAKERAHQDPPLVSPRFVARLIEECLRAGWNPEVRGAPLQLRRIEGELHPASLSCEDTHPCPR